MLFGRCCSRDRYVAYSTCDCKPSLVARCFKVRLSHDSRGCTEVRAKSPTTGSTIEPSSDAFGHACKSGVVLFQTASDLIFDRVCIGRQVDRRVGVFAVDAFECGLVVADFEIREFQSVSGADDNGLVLR